MAEPNMRILKNVNVNEISVIIKYTLKQTKFYTNEKSFLKENS